jgi:hypothetical protein
MNTETMNWIITITVVILGSLLLRSSLVYKIPFKYRKFILIFELLGFSIFIAFIFMKSYPGTLTFNIFLLVLFVSFLFSKYRRRHFYFENNGEIKL